MENYSKEELDFVLKAIKEGIRLDTRTFDEKRTQKIIVQDIPQSDKSLRIKRGLSEIEINILFKLRQNFLADKIFEDVNFKDKIMFKTESQIEFKKRCNLDCLEIIDLILSSPNPIYKSLNNFLKAHNCGLIIEINVLKNDGNLFDMFFDGIRDIFKQIHVVDLSNLSVEKVDNVFIPSVQSYACLENCIIYDPTLIEEKSAESIVHYIYDLNGEVTTFRGK